MIHYHGLPLTPVARLYELAGKHLCASFATAGRQADIALQIAQSCLWDNGAFSLHTQGTQIDEPALYRWLERRLAHPHRAVVLDRIGGDVDEQREMTARWPFDRELSWPVWHLDKPIDYLTELADGWAGVCLGSAGAYWQIGTPKWERRMDEAFDALSARRVMPWVHGLRMLGQAGNRWPLSSADSVNVARNYKDTNADPELMARRIDRVQCPISWELSSHQSELFA
jgi:hypothetical protein